MSLRQRLAASIFETASSIVIVLVFSPRAYGPFGNISALVSVLSVCWHWV